MNTTTHKSLEYHKVVWRAAREEISHNLFGELQNLIGDIVIAIASGLAYAIWSYVQQDTPIDWVGVIAAVLIGFIIWAVILFLVNLFWKVPARLYIEKDKEASKFNWDYIKFDKTEIKDGETLMAHGILIKNDKVYDLRKVIAQVQYLEIDGKSYVENRQLLQTQKGKRLGWLWNSHRLSITEQSLDKNGFEAIIDLFRILPNQLSFFELSEESRDFVAKDIEVTKYARGEILFLASFDPLEPQWIPVENIYNFSITIDLDKKTKMTLEKGRIYKPPEVER